jgi:starch synthase
LVKRQRDLTGILNGCDYINWDPQSDPYLPKPYSQTDLTNKKRSKAKLQRMCKFQLRERTPLIGMVCRLTEQKGFSYLIPILDELIQHNLQFIIVGTGDPKLCMDLEEFGQQ